MSVLRIGRTTFGLTMFSSVDRDGMALELTKGDDPCAVAEVFYSDRFGEMTIDTKGNELPLASVEWLIAQAKLRLPPAGD